MTYTFVWYRSSLVKVTGATNGKMGYMFFLFRFRNKTTFYLQAKLLVIQKVLKSSGDDYFGSILKR